MGLAPSQQPLLSRHLERKQISQNYHSSVPKFLHSEGPFEIYDHNDMKGNNQAFNSSMQGAYQRYEKDLIELKNLRKKQRSEFHSQVE